MNPPTIEDRPLPIFPCYPNKAPACGHGFKDASTNRKRIRELWYGRTGLLIAVPTGDASSISVIDVDLHWPGEALLPPARVHETKSGGLHYLYRHTPGLRCSQGLIAPGVDVRADGGYIVWWPAHGFGVQDRPIADWPEGLAVPLRAIQPLPNGHLLSDPIHDLPPPTTIKEEVAILARFKQTVPRWSREETFAHYALKNAMNEVSDAKEGQRNYILNAKGYALGRLVARGWLDGGLVAFALGHGAKCCGYVRDHGEAAAVASIRHAVLDGMRRPYQDLTPIPGPPTECPDD